MGDSAKLTFCVSGEGRPSVVGGTDCRDLAFDGDHRFAVTERGPHFTKLANLAVFAFPHTSAACPRQSSACASSWTEGRSPTAPGPAGHVQRRPVPVGVEVVDMWKWRNASFSRGRWKSFSTDMLEMREAEGDGHFQTSKTISMKMRAVHMAAAP